MNDWIIAQFFILVSLLVVFDVGGDVSQTEVAIRSGVVIVAVAHAVAAVPEQPSPPTVHFGRWLLARVFLTEYLAVLVLYVLVPSIAAFVLRLQRKETSYKMHFVYFSII